MFLFGLVVEVEACHICFDCFRDHQIGFSVKSPQVEKTDFIVLLAFPLSLISWIVFNTLALYSWKAGSSSSMDKALGFSGIQGKFPRFWIRIPAWGVGDPGFKSQRPHHIHHTRISESNTKNYIHK